MSKIKIAVVFTCFNRKEKSKKCLDAIFAQKTVERANLDLKVFICDDASNDGTYEMFIEEYPQAQVTRGTGDLFWAKGMSKAIGIAEQYNPDFYLMVNDDVDFFPEMIEVMLKSYEATSNSMCAIVGSTKDRETGKHTYGGLMWNGKSMHEVKKVVTPGMPLKECNQTNWNCFLIPRRLYETIGEIDDYYEHSYADIDYSNRIIRKGFKIYVAMDYIGYCSRNSQRGTWADKSLTFKARINALHKKTGLPVKSNWHYCAKYYGIWAPYMFAQPYLSIIKSSFFSKLP